MKGSVGWPSQPTLEDLEDEADTKKEHDSEIVSFSVGKSIKYLVDISSCLYRHVI